MGRLPLPIGLSCPVCAQQTRAGMFVPGHLRGRVGWVDHAADLDRFLSGMLYVPYALARLSSSVVCRCLSSVVVVVVCRSLALPLLSSAVGLGGRLSRHDSQTVLGGPTCSGRLAGSLSRHDSQTVLGEPTRYWDERLSVLPLLVLGGPTCSRR